jgi:hypothetical protein
MCRSIKVLRNPGLSPTEEELRAAALQYVRKVSGYRTPSRANQEAFNRAVEEIAASTRLLLDSLVSRQDQGRAPAD